MTLSVKKITLELKDGKELELSVEEARGLKRALEDLLGDGAAVMIPYYPAQYWPHWRTDWTGQQPTIQWMQGSAQNAG